MKIAYLTSHYPAISHTFVQREILALRRLGIDIETFSVREPDISDPMSICDQKEYVNTTYVLSTHWRVLIKAHVEGFFLGKKAYCKRFLFSLKLADKSPKSCLWHIFYFIEAEFIRAQFKQKGIQHCHVHFAMSATTVAMIACSTDDYTYSFTVHGPQTLSNPELYKLKEKIIHSSAVLCISNKGLKQMYLLSEKIHHSKIHLVRCGIHAESYQQLSPCKFSKSNTLNLLNVGRLVDCKGHNVLINAVSELRKINTHCTIVGGGPLQSSLSEQVDRLGAYNIKMVGPIDQDNISRFFLSAHIFVLTSWDEGVPVVLMEAMAYGLVVIATDVGAVKEIIKHEHTGLLVPVGSVTAIVNAVCRLNQDRELCIKLAVKGRELVEREFNVDRSAARIRSIICLDKDAR